MRRDSRGNTLAMAGAALVPIAGMIGSGLDMSRAYMAQAKLQNACDAAALGARREMTGAVFDASARIEGERFFDFNFPSTTMNAQNVTRTVTQSTTDDTTVVVTASADIPTSVMALFGKDFIPISIQCEANQDYGNNDIMVVLDVTGSMNSSPSGGGASKISRLRTGALGLYRALAGVTNTRTRYGIVPYSMNVNVGGLLRNRDILRDSYYPKCNSWDWRGRCNGYGLSAVHITASQWNDGGNTGNSLSAFRQSGNACVEERPTIGNSFNNGDFDIEPTVSQADIDDIAINGSDQERQYGRWDPNENEYDDDGWCPSPATRLQTYGSESAYQTAINDATAVVAGNTYHDLGLIWAARLLSSNGINASRNPTTFNGIPVAKHIVFLTDGDLVPTSSNYSSYGNYNFDRRITGSGGQESRHIARFLSACSAAKSMGMTIWVIALDLGSTGEIEPCATSSGHFFVSDGSDLEQVFERIGAGIGRLRLTQ
ncbi:TadE/TadG family type IV pilus assembly protein [Parasphingopyxis sp.]|uniref:TadE/TadG family type IV pilus assembly protein n=1 Tax=Parasphingopyxis sp. TaxID=1920299 RepID=UPI003FA0CEE3